MEKFLASWFGNNQQHQDEASPPVADEDNRELNNLYITDSPVTDPEQDKFKRWSFSQRVAQTIVSRSDPSSLVIGIYGPWGNGKTSVLNFIETDLKRANNVICVKFNPWRFTDEASLIKGFFKVLAEALGESIDSFQGKAGKWLEKYAGGLTAFSLRLGVFQVSPGQGLLGVGKTLSSVELEDLKKKLESFLEGAGTRVVVLVDDIDRLDKNEIQAVFKLIKLFADFDYTAYVLAFDEEMVASALSEKYGSGDIKAGRSFLEKIIQVPLNLPKVDRDALLDYCLEGIGQALKDSEIELSEDQFYYDFYNRFTEGLEIRLKTPRMTKRYISALAFSLPILKGEVNLTDLMLIEGMRLFYTDLYNIVKNNSDIFLCLRSNYEDSERFKERSSNVIDRGVQGLTFEETVAAKNLLKSLFPRLEAVPSNVSYVFALPEDLDKEQRVCSRHYFSRFFSYSIPDNDISDQELTSFLSQLEDNPVETTISKIRHMVGEQRADLFVRKLRNRVENLSSSSSQKLAIAISRVGEIFSNDNKAFITYFFDAGTLINKLVKNISDSKVQVEAAKQIVLEAEPIAFAVECSRWLIPGGKSRKIEAPLSADQGRIVGEAFAQKIKSLSQNSLLYLQFPEDARSLMHIWSSWGDREEVKQYLLETLNKAPESVVEFLKCYPPRQWVSGQRGSGRGDFSLNEYHSLAEYIDPGLVYRLLQNIYGSKLDNPEYDSDDQQRSLEDKVANQFAFIHQAEIRKDGDNS